MNYSRTYTTLGTPYYMAPEVMKGKGYSFYADLWSLGIIIYELYTGRFPFGKNCKDPMEIYNQIIDTQKILFPVGLDDEAKTLIEILLNKQPHHRLPLGSYAKLKIHSFFHMINWVYFLIIEGRFVRKERNFTS